MTGETKKRGPLKLSGLIKSGAVVPAELAADEPPSAAQAREVSSSESMDRETKPPHVAEVVYPPTLPASPAEPTNGRDIRLIAVGLIDPNPLAPREVYTANMILERAEDLRSQGQHDPIHVIPNPESIGRFIIADGWTRVQACITHAVQDALLAEVHTNLTLFQAAWFGYEQNESRTQHCDLDRAMFYEKMILAGETSAEIARRAKLSRTMMTFFRSYAKLPTDVLDIIRQNPAKFGATEAYQLARLNDKCGLRRAVALAGKYAAEDQPVRWLTNQVQSAINPTGHKSSAPSKQVRYANGYYKQRGDAFELNITVDAERREAFAVALEQLLDTVAVEVTPASDAKKAPEGGEG